MGKSFQLFWFQFFQKMSSMFGLSSYVYNLCKYKNSHGAKKRKRKDPLGCLSSSWVQKIKITKEGHLSSYVYNLCKYKNSHGAKKRKRKDPLGCLSSSWVQKIKIMKEGHQEFLENVSMPKKQ